MIKLIDISFVMHRDLKVPLTPVTLYRAAYGYAEYADKKILDVVIVQHMDHEGDLKHRGVEYHFFRRRDKFWQLPFKTYRFIKHEHPDVVLVQGLIFPMQLIFLKLFVAKKCKIMVQHHGERPFTGVKKMFQRAADRFVDGYVFTSAGNAEPWIKEGIVGSYDKCYELLEASTYLQRKSKEASRNKLQLRGSQIFLWVGRLEVNKDPLTVLLGFEKYLSTGADAKLYIIYQEEDLLPEVQRLIGDSPLLKEHVTLVGKIKHEELSDWFSAADYFLSGSHKEAAGYALIEAMACGCIPIVTNIPPFKKIAGALGFFYEPGNAESLCNACLNATKIPVNDLSEKIVNYFNRELSFKNIADGLADICTRLIGKS